MWTVGNKLAVGFAVAVVLLGMIGSVAYRSINRLTSTSFLVTHSHQILEKAEDVLSQMRDGETGQRGFIITGDESFLEPYHTGMLAVPRLVNDLRQLTASSPTQQARAILVESLVAARMTELQLNLAVRRSGGLEAAVQRIQASAGKKVMDDLRQTIAQIEDEERGLLDRRAEEARAAAAGGRFVIVVGTLSALAFLCIVGTVLTRTLSRQIGTAVGQMQTSSAELQSAATQQASGSRQQATAMNEISTTISELLATSRQITESAQRVAQIAAETAAAARSGDETVISAEESIADIRRQVDQLVNHMLDLGRKSQQIGEVIAIVSELAEQTNILAINATIEAAGAGESGRRFAVVAEEIRKLADRTAGSVKEIATLVENVRTAVNTTVMTTETGSKSVDAGSKRFGRVAASFKQITELVTTTSEAAREIELSIKQQMTAIEQVNVAMEDLAQTSNEVQASAGQTQQTASHLALLSLDLRRLVQPQAVV